MPSQAFCELAMGPRQSPFLSLSLRLLCVQEYVLPEPLLGKGKEQ